MSNTRRRGSLWKVTAIGCAISSAIPKLNHRLADHRLRKLRLPTKARATMRKDSLLVWLTSVKWSVTCSRTNTYSPRSHRPPKLARLPSDILYFFCILQSLCRAQNGCYVWSTCLYILSRSPKITLNLLDAETY